jgi:hypothetical protein
MQRLLPAVLMVWIDHGADEDWGPMCYPRQDGANPRDDCLNRDLE